jgi:hypothetical protein
MDKTKRNNRDVNGEITVEVYLFCQEIQKYFHYTQAAAPIFSKFIVNFTGINSH